MRHALAQDFHAVDDVEVVMTLDSRFAERQPFRVVSVGVGEELATFARLTAECDYTLVVAPETGGVLAQRVGLIDSGKSLGSSPSAVELAGDKVRLACFLESRGVPTIATRSVRIGNGVPDGAVFPAVLKPIDGAGCSQTFVLECAQDWPRRLDLPTVMAWQPFLAGEPLSATFLVSDSGARLVAVGRQLIVVRDGSITYQGGTLPLPARYADGPPWEAIQALEGLRGLVGIDFLRESETGRSIVVEINPRPTTSVVGLVRLLGPGRLAQAWRESHTDAMDMISGDDESIIHFTAEGAFIHAEDR